VYWVNYFGEGEAIHWYQRASYGWYQSDGCVEVPTTIAESIYDGLNYGALVTVQGAQA
jgi:lipoprotein-anchoring transpeptidase ErfK/SrfK